MNEQLTLRAAKFPKLMAELSHSNQFLKFFSVSTLLMTLLTLLVLLLTVGRPPLVLTLSNSGQILEQISPTNPEEHIRAAMTHYIDLRYKWTPKEIKTQLNTAKAFILPKNLKAFETASVNLTKFAIEKGVTQRIFPETISVSIPNKTVRVLGDRITSIQGLKAAADLKLEFTIESGERTKENPWGIYITKEREE